MTKIIVTLIGVLILCVFSIQKVIGQVRSTLTPTSTIAPTKSSESKEIDKFKEKLASKVAELTKKNQKVLAGTIGSVDKKKFKLMTENDGEFEVKIDEDLTKFYSILGNQKIEKRVADLKKGMYIIVSGPLIDKVIDANIVYQDEQFLVDFGRIIEANKADNSLVITTLAKENYTLDIELQTKQDIINIKTFEIERGAFSKIRVGDSVHFVVKYSPDIKNNRYSATKVLIIPQEYFIK